MAADETPSRIDTVFKDGDLVTEALRLGPREAIARHQASSHPPTPSAHANIPLSPEDFSEERTVKGLVQWFEERLAAINECPVAERPALLHRDPFKQFYEEMFPFVHFVRHLYEDRNDVVCFLNPTSSSDQDYDAVIRDCSSNPPIVTYVQLTTTTFDRDQSRRMEYFLKHGWVPAWAPINERGEVDLELIELISHEEKLAQTFDAIERAARRKSDVSYGRDYVLVVSFDDFMWFGTGDDRAALQSFVSTKLADWHLNVAVLHVLGISGRTFESFPVPRR